MRVKLIIFILLAITMKVSAQHKGIVLDTDSIPLEYATITLLNPKDSTFIAGTITNELGMFSVKGKSSQVLVRVSYPGYSPVYRFVQNENIGIIKLKALQLDEVVITANASKVISRKIDRLVYNVENDPFAKNKTVIEVLEQTPRININGRDRTIGMIGRTGVRIMIDEHILSDDEAKSFIANLKSEEIATIEVIPVPPAKYHAEGDVGLVNIKLRTNPSEGLQGNLTLNYNQTTRSSSFPTGSLNWHKGIWSIRFGVAPRFYNGEQNSGESFIYDDKIFDRTSYMDAKLRNYSGNFMIQIKPSSKFEIGAIIEGGLEDNRFSEDIVSGYNIETSQITTVQTSSPKHLHFNGSVYGDLSYGNKGGKLTLTYNNHFHRKGIDDHFLTNENNKNKNFVSSGTYYYRTNSILADLAIPLSIARIETGTSAQMVDNTCDLGIAGDVVTNMIDDRTYYRYDENIIAAYLSAGIPLGAQVYAKAGIRYEYTNIRGKARGAKDKVSQNYHDIFPTAFLSWDINNSNTLSINYARRIQRPYFEDLNPFMRYYDINKYDSGNPDLKPAMSDNMEINFSFKGNLNVTLWGNLLHDNIDYIPLILENGTQTQQVLNCSDTRKGGLSISYNFNKIEWFSIFAQGSAYYSHSHCYIPDLNIQDKEGWGGNFNIYGNFFMNKKKTLRGGISFWQSLPSTDNLIKAGGVASLGIDFSYSLLQDRLNLSLGANDLFNQSINKSHRYYADYKYTTFTNSYQRSIWIGVGWKFGKRTINNVNINAKDVIGNRGL